MDQPSCYGLPAAAASGIRPSRFRPIRKTRLRHLLAFALAIASTSAPAGLPDESEATNQLQRERELAIRTAAVVEDARVAHIAQRYRRGADEIRRVVRATEQAALRNGLPASLLLAIIETESSFNAKAQSAYGARGLMQVVPRHHPKIIASIGGVRKLEDPETNLEAGALILADYVERSGSLHKGLARYSGGARKYAARVLERKRELDRIAVHALGDVQKTRLSEALPAAGRS